MLLLHLGMLNVACHLPIQESKHKKVCFLFWPKLIIFFFSDSSSTGKIARLGKFPFVPQVGFALEIGQTTLWFHTHDGIRKLDKNNNFHAKNIQLCFLTFPRKIKVEMIFFVFSRIFSTSELLEFSIFILYTILFQVLLIEFIPKQQIYKPDWR